MEEPTPGWLESVPRTSVCSVRLTQSLCISFVSSRNFSGLLCLFSMPASSASPGGNEDCLIFVCAEAGDKGGDCLLVEPAWW